MGEGLRFCYSRFMKSWLGAIPALMLISGCALFQRSPSTSVGVNPSVEDVPYAARGDDTGLRHRIFVLPFLDAQKGRSQNVAEQARAAVIRELSRTGRF